MLGADRQIIETLDQMLASASDDLSPHADQDEWPAGLWQTLEDAGFTRAWGAERHGGAQASWFDGLAMLTSASQYAPAVALAETLMAAWICRDLHVDLPDGPLAVVNAPGVQLNENNVLEGSLAGLPFGPHLSAILFCLAQNDEPQLVCVGVTNPCAGKANLAGEPCATVSVAGVKPLWVSRGGEWTADSIERLGATVRSAQMAGALTHLLERTVTYAQERKQFGRAISKFQAVQHNLAVLAGEIAAANGAANAAASAVHRFGISSDEALLAIASAKIRCGQAATQGSAIAHQVHGAMGFAREYPLHRYTRRLWVWRDSFGSETEWAERLGAHVVGVGADDFWSLLTAG